MGINFNSGRINTQRQGHRGQPKYTQINQYFKEDNQGDTMNNWLTKRSSYSSKRKHVSISEIWKNHEVSPLQTPKHTISDKQKLFQKMKFTNTNSAETPEHLTYRERLMSRYNSQPALNKHSSKRKLSPKAHQIGKNGYYTNRAYYMNGKKITKVQYQ